MGIKNYLIEGLSSTGKTMAEELQRRGYHVVHDDRELAYQGDPKTGERRARIEVAQSAFNVTSVS